MNNANALTAQQIHAAIVAKEVSVADAIALLTARIERCEAEGRKPRAPSVQLLKELQSLKPKANVATIKNPVDALKAAKADKSKAKAEPAKPVKAPAKPAKEPAKAADAKPEGLTDAQLLSLVWERASVDAAFRSQIGKLFIELANA